MRRRRANLGVDRWIRRVASLRAPLSRGSTAMARDIEIQARVRNLASAVERAVAIADGSARVVRPCAGAGETFSYSEAGPQGEHQ